MTTSRRSFLKLGAAAPLAAIVPTAMAKASTVTDLASGEIAVAMPVSSPPAWGWWAANDGGERFTLGPFATREEVIAEARSYWNGETFSLIEAVNGKPDLRLFGDDIVQLVDDQNEDHWDRDGDCTIFTGEISKEALEDLGNVVSAAIAAWVERHDIEVRSFAFGNTRNAEDVPEAASPAPDASVKP